MIIAMAAGAAAAEKGVTSKGAAVHPPLVAAARDFNTLCYWEDVAEEDVATDLFFSAFRRTVKILGVSTSTRGCFDYYFYRSFSY